MLLLLPYERIADRNHPPVVTIFLILLNSFVFFAVQGTDDARWATATNYYFASPLPEIELPAYIAHLERTGQTLKAERARALPRNHPASTAYLLRQLQYDRAFLKQLDNEEVIPPTDARHTTWKPYRTAFNAYVARVVTWEYAFHADRAITYVTSLFLHASFTHLFVNMLFLLMFGVAVERVLGHGQFFVSYLIGGLASLALWVLLIGDKGGIGASGAVTGLMGIYTVVYGARRLRFFCWFIVRAEYVTAPALILLPIWLLVEVYNHTTGHGVGYVAHIGGFAGGVLLALVQTRVLHSAHLERRHEYVRNDGLPLSPPRTQPIDGDR